MLEKNFSYYQAPHLYAYEARRHGGNCKMIQILAWKRGVWNLMVCGSVSTASSCTTYTWDGFTIMSKKTIQITKWCSVVTKREKFLSPYPLPTTILEKNSKTLKTTILQVMKILLQSCKKTFGHETCTQVRFITGDIKQEMWKEQKSIYAILYFVFWYLIQIFLATNIS